MGLARKRQGLSGFLTTNGVISLKWKLKMDKDDKNTGFTSFFSSELIEKYITNPKERNPKVRKKEKAECAAVKAAFTDIGLNILTNYPLVIMTLADAQRILAMLGACDPKNPTIKGSTLRLMPENDEKDNETDKK